MDTLKTFVVDSAENGGVTIKAVDYDRPHHMHDLLGAFTTPADMITWLADQYGLQSHPTPKPEAVEAPVDLVSNNEAAFENRVIDVVRKAKLRRIL